MKYIVTIFIIFTSSVIFSLPIDKNTAEKVAVKFMARAFPDKGNYTISNTNIQYINGIATIYEIEFETGGFIIIPADDAIIPVLAFSNEGRLDKTDIAPATEQLYQYYNQTVWKAKQERTPNTYTAKKWDILLDEHTTKEVDDTIVAPLIQTRWGQSRTNDVPDGLCPGYNHYIIGGKDSDCTDHCDNCTVGCGAVAMGQIMRYWAHPVQAGGYFFDWCAMPEELLKFDNQILRPEYERERNAIARLLQVCGEQSDMIYCIAGTCSSFNFPTDMRNAFEDNFGYKNDIEVKRRQYYSDSKWKKFLKNDLNENKPIIYGAIRETEKGISTHAFICDGYGSFEGIADYFHFNFGWRGSHDGYFHIDTIDPGDYWYKHLERIIIGIEPDNESSDECQEDIIVMQSFINYLHGLRYFYYHPFANNIYTSETDPVDISIFPLDSVEYSAYTGIHLRNFRVRSGVKFRARLTDCPANCGDAVRFAQTDKNTITETYPESNIRESEAHTMKIYPNPASTHISIQVQGLVNQGITYRLYNTQAMQLSEIRSGHSQLQIPVSHLPEGIYILHIIGKDINMSRKIVLKK